MSGQLAAPRGLFLRIGLVGIAALVAFYGSSLGARLYAADAWQGCPTDRTPTKIGEIQGREMNSPKTHLGEQRTVLGTVVGFYRGPSLTNQGFYVQNDEANSDGDPETSDGIFVNSDPDKLPLKLGDSVMATGIVKDGEGNPAYEQTRLFAAHYFKCGSSGPIKPIAITLPVTNETALEKYEGMLVTLPQTLYVTEMYQLGQFGQFVVSSGGRLFQPTSLAAPGAEAMALQKASNLSRLMIDDSDDTTNRHPALFPAGGLSAKNGVRMGDTVSGITGALGFNFSVYRVQVNAVPTFTASNPRPAAPPKVPGSIRVISANVLNYFNGDGKGGSFPTTRGASSPAELTRQQAKLINMLKALDADVIGLMEMENDEPPQSATEEVVEALNAAVGAGTYSFIPTGRVGTDEIRNVILYKPGKVKPIGKTAALDNVAPFNVNSRPPLAQAFEVVGGPNAGEKFIVVVNHFKSKSCGGATEANQDKNDGQSCFNADRVTSSQALLAWLAKNPTETGSSNILIIGDLNAYAKEDPITALIAGGYTNLIEKYQGANAYSYVFSAQSGYLDHALASAGLLPNVKGTDHWHINADEPLAFDYNDDVQDSGENAGNLRQPGLYDPAPFRVSDHDPVIIGLFGN